MRAVITRTNHLKKLVQTKLKTITTDVYFEIAKDNAIYPHVVFDFETVNLGDLSREDFILAVDVWDQNENTTNIDNMCDQIEDLFSNKNLPQTNILPTFFKIDRRTVIDPDKSIKHRLIRFQIQNYER